MKFKGTFTRALLGDKGIFEVTFQTKDRPAVEKLRQGGTESELDVSTTKHREHRSLDANAYFWKVAQNLSEAMSEKHCKPISKEDIYREYIHDVGAFKTIPIAESDIPFWTKIWESKGLGWIVEDIGECKKTKGYHNLHCYYGSSCYDTAQMGRLIDLLIADCDQYGVEHRTQEEIDYMNSLWGDTE